MRRVLPATPAEFLDLQPIRSGFPVLGGRIIPLFAITALQRNDLSGHSAPSFFLCGAGPLPPEKICGASLPLDGRGGSFPQLYCTISPTVPSPTAFPPSPIANRRAFSISTGAVNPMTQCH